MRGGGRGAAGSGRRGGGGVRAGGMGRNARGVLRDADAPRREFHPDGRRRKGGNAERAERGRGGKRFFGGGGN